MITDFHLNQRHLFTEQSPHQFTAFASDLSTIVPEFRTGFPPRINATIGNGRPLYAISKVVRDGDIQYVRYGQECGCIQIKVFND